VKIKDSHTLKVRIGLIAIIIAALHVTLSLSVIFAPKRSISSSKILMPYKQLFVVGPFFTASRIETSQYLGVRFKHLGTWSAVREYGKENFLSYSQKPWRFDRLPYNDYEKRLCSEVGEFSKNKTFEQVKRNSSFRELNKFLLSEYIHLPVDSLRLTYALYQYIPKTKSYSVDTVFSYKYNPNTLDDARN